MIFTSYFANIKNLPEKYIPISICGKAPDKYTGIQYKKLAPKYKFFMEWKENHNNDFYIEHFQKEVLDTLDISTVLQELYELLPTNVIRELCVRSPKWWKDEEYHIVFICYEKPEDFCHRHLVAKWFTENGIIVKEF